MYKQINELINQLESERKCEVKLVNREEHIYQIDSLTGLTWNQRAKKFGEFQAEEERFRLELDLPIQYFSPEELKTATGLPLKEEADAETESYVDPTFNRASYDSVCIIVSRHDLENYSFEKKDFSSWLQKVINGSVT